MPKENIERAVKKGTGELEGVDYQEVTYEGYGPAGVALLIDAVTDNPTRTVAEVRAKMIALGGNLGTPNSVAWMFEKKGQIYVDATTIDEDASHGERRSRPAPRTSRARTSVFSSRRRPSDFHVGAGRARRQGGVADRRGRARDGAEEHRADRRRGRASRCSS